MVGLTSPDSTLFSVLLPFEGERVDILGSHIAKQQRCVGGIQPKPYSECSRVMDTFQIGYDLWTTTRDRNSKDSRVTRCAEKVKEAAIARPRDNPERPL
jgi:hypothetical protein